MKLELRNVSQIYGNSQVLHNLTATIEWDQGVLLLMGGSGSGKSTLLRILCGLEAPSSGEVIWNDEILPGNIPELRAHRRRTGVVFQDSNLFPHLNVLDNVTLALTKVHGLSASQAVCRAEKELARFRLETHAYKRTWELSGGQKQRVALARALAIGAQTILLDEPTSALDPEMTWEVLQAVEEVAHAGKTIILSTHEVAFARRSGKRALILADGKIVESGDAQEILRAPRSTEFATYLKRVLLDDKN